MQTQTFIKFLQERNRSFITQMSSESALGMIDSFKAKKASKSKCIVISFDPPLSYPPFAFNWADTDVCYLNEASLTLDFYKKVEQACLDVELPYIVFVEKKNLFHKRKIVRWIKGFKETVFRNKPLSEMPSFLLAEYQNPFSQLSICEVKVDD